jgi:hypothetical protein
MKSGNQTTVSPNNLRAYQPSDRIELTNSIGMSIGSGDSGVGWAVPNDEAYVEFFNMAGSTPAFVTQYVLTSTSQPPTYDYDHYGLANDLAISRDGDWAVVNSDNWIDVFFLGQFPSLITHYSFNIGGFDYATSTAWNRSCSPNLAVDSVALTNERAVVTTARMSSTFGTFTTWVYIVDLTGSTPAISLQQEIVPPGTWDPDGDDYDRPHDIAITPARLQDRMAIVTTTHGVAAFDLTNDVLLSTYFDQHDWRHYQQQVDSVELTDEDALVIADNDSSVPTRWHVLDFRIVLGTGLVPGPEWRGSGASRAHDLAIDLGFDKAIVRATNENVCIQGLTTTPGATILTSPSSSDAYAYEQFRQQTQYNIFSSDAAVIAPETTDPITNQTFMFAATIGAYQDPTSGLWTGAVDLIDLNTAPLSVIQVPIAPNAAPGCVPVDLAISANHAELVVRSADPNVEVSPATGPDLVRISLVATPAIVFSYGGRGTVMGLDSLAAPQLGFVAVAKRILSISEQEGMSTGDDYTHINK